MTHESEMNERKRKGVDQRVKELAEHFLADVDGALPEDVTEFAEDIQELCEDYCATLEEVIANCRRRPGAGP